MSSRYSSSKKREKHGHSHYHKYYDKNSHNFNKFVLNFFFLRGKKIEWEDENKNF